MLHQYFNNASKAYNTIAHPLLINHSNRGDVGLEQYCQRKMQQNRAVRPTICQIDRRNYLRGWHGMPWPWHGMGAPLPPASILRIATSNCDCATGTKCQPIKVLETKQHEADCIFLRGYCCTSYVANRQQTGVLGAWCRKIELN